MIYSFIHHFTKCILRLCGVNYQVMLYVHVSCAHYNDDVQFGVHGLTQLHTDQKVFFLFFPKVS